MAVTVAGILLAPYATVNLNFRTALMVQALIIVSLTLLAAIAGVCRWRGLGGITGLPSPIALGLVCYSAAAISGFIVALVRGNDIALAAGQLLSMGLLPLGLVAGASLVDPHLPRRFSWSLVATTSFLVVFHFAVAVAMIARGHTASRMYLENAVSVAGPSLLALLMALALAAAHGSRIHDICLAATLLIGGYILASGTRSLWVASAIGVAAYFVCFGGVPVATGRKWTIAMVVVVLGVVAGVVGLWAWLGPHRQNQLGSFPGPAWRTPSGTFVDDRAGPLSQPAIGWGRPQRSYVLTEPVPVVGGGLYRWRFDFAGTGRGQGQVALYWYDEAGQLCRVAGVSRAATAGWERIERMVNAPQTAVSCSLVVGTDPDVSGRWFISRVSLERLRPAFLGRLWSEGHFVAQRVGSVFSIAFGTAGGREPSLSVRLAETRTVLELMGEAGTLEKLFGHGLGAQYQILDPQTGGAGPGPERRNYLHNFYAFLFFKTGVLGTLAVLASFGMWLTYAWRASRRTGTKPQRAFLAALFAAWSSYIAWSVVCPEILDFRMAPIWGFALAAMAQANGRSQISSPTADEGRTD